MYPSAYDDAGKLVLRITLGVLMLFHGIAKLGGVERFGPMLSNAGLPSFIAYGVYLGEIVGPLMLIAGFYARVGAALMVINMIFAILLVHAGEIAAFSNNGGMQLELQYLFLFGSVAAMLMSPGRFAVNNR